MEKIDKHVAFSMAVIALILAAVSLFADRESGNMITYQAQANNYQAQANMARTKATDTWSYFQAKIMRKHLYLLNATMLDALNVSALQKAQWIESAKRYRRESKDLLIEAKRLDRKSDALQQKAISYLMLSAKTNKRVDVLDLSRLCAEIGLILCSLAIVSQKRFLWVSGLISGFISIGIFASLHIKLFW